MSADPDVADVALPGELCLIGEAAAGAVDAASALRLLGELAVARGYAHPSYVDAVLAREVEFPTGLPLPVPVAIPHADARHVARPALAALVPPAPLRFGEMGGAQRTVDVELVLMLLVDDPAHQVGLLGRLIGVLRRPELRELLLVDLHSGEELSARFHALLADGDAGGPRATP